MDHAHILISSHLDENTDNDVYHIAVPEMLVQMNPSLHGNHRVSQGLLVVHGQQQHSYFQNYIL